MGVEFTDVIERMKRAGNLKNDSKVARVLGVTPQAISNYKKRGAIPADLVMKFADMYGLSVDWLIRGEGEVYRPGYEGKALINFAADNVVPYGSIAKKDIAKLVDIASLSPEELVYVGKLIKVLRDGEGSAVSVIKWSVDSFYNAMQSAATADDAKNIQKKGA
ncbi:MAG: helix-turn-helix domain containing protein [Deltaproteobacteria bacterium]|nr:helix-turn-helix domain containing protein [Deltaproteobacteria bacterium]